MEVERYRIGQDELNRLYQIAEYRKKNRPDMAERFQAILRGCTYYRSEKDALAVALEKVKNKNYRCLICVGYKKEGGVFRIDNRWLVTDEPRIIQAADYLCLALMYDNTRLQIIADANMAIDDVVAYC